MQTVIRGTQTKIAITVDGLPQGVLQGCEFWVRFYTPTDSLRVSKEQLSHDYGNTYVAKIDTGMLGRGTLMVEIHAYIPDQDFTSGFRTEIARASTGLAIVE